jgi:hypothetical protein
MQQVAESAGHCPWCGRAFNKDYAANLIRSVQQAEESGNLLEGALEQIADMGDAGLEIDEETVLQPLRNALDTIRRQGGARV